MTTLQIFLKKPVDYNIYQILKTECMKTAKGSVEVNYETLEQIRWSGNLEKKNWIFFYLIKMSKKPDWEHKIPKKCDIKTHKKLNGWLSIILNLWNVIIK